MNHPPKGSHVVGACARVLRVHKYPPLLEWAGGGRRWVGSDYGKNLLYSHISLWEILCSNRSSPIRPEHTMPPVTGLILSAVAVHLYDTVNVVPFGWFSQPILVKRVKGTSIEKNAKCQDACINDLCTCIVYTHTDIDRERERKSNRMQNRRSVKRNDACASIIWLNISKICLNI